MLKAIFFDLDGTLLPLNEDEFMKIYFGLLCGKMVNYGYNPEELTSVIWNGTTLMYKNDGSKTNEEAFWNYFKEHYGDEKYKDKIYLDEFYLNEFKKTQDACGDNLEALEIIDFCKKNKLKIILSTNPIFPKEATMCRMSYIGLKESDFEFVTTYENSSYCKPNPKYFMWLLDKYDLKPEEVIVFGNNTYEDGECALSCGMKCYMVGDYVINHPKSVHKFEHIKINEIIDMIKKHMSI